jgi:sugar/nucleoside kinase (ribokinase family)
MTLAAIDYLLIGHISADIAPNDRQLGGTVSYAAGTVQGFGLRVGILTSAAQDEPLLHPLQKIAQVVALPAPQTTTFENIYHNGSRTQIVHGTAAPIREEHVPPIWQSPPLVHLAPLIGEIGPELVSAFPNSTKLLTPQGWLRRCDSNGRVRFKRWFAAEILRAIDIVVLSEEDIAAAPDLEQQYAGAARYLVVTRGDKGGTYYCAGRSYHYDAAPVDAKYPTGAGDVFAASLLAAWPKLQDFHKAILIAAKLAAYSTTREGLHSAPTPEEVRAAFDSIK